MLSFSTFLLLITSLGIALATDTLDIELSQTRINYTPVDYSFTIRSDGFIDVPVGSTIQVTFPTDYSSILPSSVICEDDFSRTRNCSVSVSQRKVTITNYFTAGRTDNTFTFKITGITNPSHTGDTSFFSASIISPSATTLVKASQAVAISEGTASCSMTADSNVLGAATKVKFNIIPSNFISANGGLEITLPKWSSQGESMVSSPNSITCKLTSPVSNTPGACYMTSDNNIIKVENLLSSQIAAGSSITFEFTSIRNPPLPDPYTFQIRTLDSNGLGIDKCSPTLKVTSPNNIVVDSRNFLTCITNSNKKEINTVEVCILTFRTTNPLPKGAAINIRFPTEVGISSSLRVNEDSPVPISSLTIVSSYPDIRLTNAVSAYTAGSTKFDIRFLSIKHPNSTRPTSSFEITTLVNGSPIDTITTGVSYSASPGDISNLQITADPSEAGSLSKITFSFVLENILSTSSQIRIVFPTEFTNGTSPVTCSGASPNVVTTPTCSFSSNVLTVSKYALTSLSSSDSVAITVNNIIIPPNTKPTISPFDITTIEDIFNVDRNNQFYFQSTVAIITSNVQLSIQAGAEVAGKSDYTITFQNRNPIPTSGRIQIGLPVDRTIAISDQSLVESGTKAEIGGALNTFPTVVNNTSPATITFSNPTLSQIAPGTTIKITLPDLINPPNTGSTNSFIVRTLTSDGYPIDLIATGLSVPANTILASDFSSLDIGLTPSTTGATSVYKFSIIPKVLHIASNTLTISFPSSINFLSAVTCQVLQPQPKAQINCLPSPSKEISFTLDQDVQALQTFEVNIAGVINPKVANSYQGFVLATKTASNAKIHQTTSQVSVTIDPSVITDINLARTTNLLGQVAVFTFSFVPKNQYPGNAFIEVIIPSQLSMRTSPKLICSGIQGMSQEPSCQIKDGTSRTLSITNGGPYSASRISFSLDSLINQVSMVDSDSFKINVKDSTGGIIDQVTSGLEALAPCHSSCLTCLSNDKYSCTSCPTGKLFDIVNLKCLDTCGVKTYQDGNQCKACYSSCQLCTGPNPNQCTACNTASSLPALYNQQCLAGCPDKFYADNSGVCQTCISPCDTCTSSTQCKSCVSGTFLINGQCSNDCPRGYFKDIASRKCLACKPSCLTCNSLSTCSSCDVTSKYPIFFNDDCLSVCPDGTYSSDNTCKPCQSPCSTCSLSATLCLSCVPGFYPDKGVCKPCSSPCQTCTTAADMCSSCIGDNLFVQDSKCVTSCSESYFLNFATKACEKCSQNCLACSSSTRCITCDPSSSTPLLYSGTCVEKCPEDAPIISHRECFNPSYFMRINPYIGIYTSGLPFPFIIFGLVICVLSSLGKMVSNSTMVISNIIGFLSLLEFGVWIAFLSLLSLTHYDGIENYPGFPLGIFAIVISIALNVYFYFKIIRPLTKTQGFAKWKNTKKAQRVSAIVFQTLSIISFKSFRLIYSKFFGLDVMSAEIPQFKNFNRSLNKYTGINFFFSVLLFVIAAIITLNKDSDFPQLLNISIEVIVISLVTTILTIYDAIHTIELEAKTNVMPEESNLMVSQSKVLSMLGRSMMEKLNESGEASKKDFNRFNKLREYKRRNSLNLDSSYEFNESELHGQDANSFIRLSSTHHEKRLGQSIDNKRNEESFGDSMDGHYGRDGLHIDDVSRIEAIKEIEKDYEDEEPSLNKQNNKTLRKLKGIIEGRGQDMRPGALVERKEGNKLMMIKGSPTKSQLAMSQRDTDRMRTLENKNKLDINDLRDSGVVFEKAPYREGEENEDPIHHGEVFILQQRNFNTPNKQQGNQKKMNGQGSSDNSEEELELEDTYENFEKKFGNTNPKSKGYSPSKFSPQKSAKMSSPVKSLKTQSPNPKSLKKGEYYSSPMKTDMSKKSQKTAEKNQDYKDQIMEAEDYETINRELARRGNLIRLVAVGASPGKTEVVYQSPNKQKISDKKNKGDGVGYVSSSSKSIEDTDNYFNDDTPNNYNAMNQRYEEDLAPPPGVNGKNRVITKTPPKQQTSDSPQKPAFMHNYIEKQQKQANSAQKYQSYGTVDGDSLNSLAKADYERENFNNHHNKSLNSDKVASYNSIGKRSATPQSLVIGSESEKRVPYRRNVFGEQGYQTLETFAKKPTRKAESLEKEGNFGKMTEKEKQEKLDRLQNIYSSGLARRKSKVKGSGSKIPRGQTGSQNSFEDHGVDNGDLELQNYEKFEEFVNEMKQQTSINESDAQSLDRHEI